MKNTFLINIQLDQNLLSNSRAIYTVFVNFR